MQKVQTLCSNVLHFSPSEYITTIGHYVGFCSGCEKWHTGVLWLRRGYGEKCLAEWGNILTSGKYDTDQESLDEAEKIGSCSALVNIPSRHLLFAKDYIGYFFTTGQTFVHVTAAGRIETQVRVLKIISD